jgi:negative regulator of flagellin synthesis FlgM
MKIGQTPDNSIQVQLGNASGAQKAGQNANANASAAATSGAAQSTRSAGVAVTVSTLARGLEKSGRNEGADVDAQKVASVRAAIENGSYVVNPEAIADKLLTNAQEMLSRTTS